MKIEEIYGDNIIINKFKVMVAAAGTGGHIYPGLAISEYFLEQSIPVSWVGTPKGMENSLVDKYKIPFYSISISGIRGKGLLPWINLPFMLFKSILQSIKALRTEKPNFVIIMGGYIGIPMAIASKILGIHLIIHEQNAVPGLSNKVISIFANKIFCGFKNSLKKAKVIGNPIRKKILNISNPQQRFKNKKGPLNILILGGSLGASTFNSLLPPILNKFNSEQVSIIHQSGEKHYEELMRTYKSLAIGEVEKNPPWLLSTEKFIYDIEEKYEWADIVIGRSGALTVSEFMEAGIASILIPYPYAVDNHQYHNAKILEDKKSAIIINENEINNKLLQILKKINRKECFLMALRAKKNKLNSNVANKIYLYCKEINNEK
ncbi:undecaprenyldiphospho-muramoylpentapeptide beta-N-acetylglucosaminyltransferase [Methylophilaceae bacterium]|jgi:UDP-N-acetylglucosamine--N-acetylmuramyl-(pentapeptide) pyrophosphoryl-undecaprenol N-acetylglucosamine transferase|nr:undecaprenyldiphospho-muramoylpentapeptide beta-N-acetylglucosaminyltransferase [Methylophilaceae bacterium]